MPASFTELVAARTKEQFLAQLLAALQGVGYTRRLVGSGLGAVLGRGSPTGEADLWVRVTASGTLGTASFQFSLDSGASYSSAIQVPAPGLYTVPGTGVTLLFDVSGATSVAAPYVEGDVYAMRLTVSSIPVTAWQPGSTALTLIENDADVDADLSQLIQAVAAGGILSTASGPWLDLLAWNLYGLRRSLAKTTAGLVTFTAAAGVGPYTLTVGDRIVATSGGLQFTTTSGGTLVGGGALQVSVQASQAGAAYNVGNGTINKLLTPLAGVTVSNPDPGPGTWVTSYGSDDEADASLRQRCRDRWQALGAGATAATYDYWARTASANVNRTNIYADPVVGGQVDVVLAGASGPVLSGDVAAVLAYIRARIPLTNTVSVVSATGVAVAVTATVYVASALLTAAQAQCPANLQALIAGTDVGGTVFLSEVITALSSPTGVSHVVVASPVADVVLTATQVATLTQTLTYVAE